MTTQVPPITTAELNATATFEGGQLATRFVGTADSRAMKSIDSLLKALHEEALRLQVREVTIDLTQLEFMNSSCFKAFVTWIGNLQDLESPKQYSIVFKSDDNKHWQRRSLEALSCFAVDLIRVET